MDSHQYILSQNEWDNLNQNLCQLLDLEYTPIQYEPEYFIHTPQSANGFSETNNISLKPWMLTDPNGNIFICNNLAKFCRDNNLVINKMRAVSKGRKKTHRGWRCQCI